MITLKKKKKKDKNKRNKSNNNKKPPTLVNYIYVWVKQSLSLKP